MYGGKMVNREKLIDVSKGGKTFLEQAIQDASRSYINKRDKQGYTANIEDLKSGDLKSGDLKPPSISNLMIRPMLAYKFDFKDLNKKKQPITFQ